MDGSAFVVYNLGLIDHRVTSVEHKVNDNLFHVLRLYRSGPNVSLQIDDLPTTEKHPTGIWAGLFYIIFTIFLLTSSSSSSAAVASITTAMFINNTTYT